MATLSDMIGSVKENLGNRSSGLIGGTDVDTVVLAALNKGFKNIIKLANPQYYDRIAYLQLVVGTVDYPEPTTDVDGNSIRIKQVKQARLNLDGETGIYQTKQITINQYLTTYVQDTSEPGIPSTYCYHNRTFKFTKYPESTYDFTFAVNIQPADFTFSQINEVLAIDDVWIETIEAYATHYCFAKLQLTTNAAFWYSIYDTSKSENKGVIYKQPGIVSPTDYTGTVADPLTDPFTRSFNS